MGDGLRSACYRLPLPLEPDWQRGWKPYYQFKGPSRNMGELACHASVLIPGHCPHAPHLHDEEEILIMLSGEADLILPQGGDHVRNERMRAGPGDFVYYPSQFPHTLQAVGPQPASYLMFKWTSEATRTGDRLGFLPMRLAWPDPAHVGRNGYLGRGLFEGPTQYLRKLHCHTSCVVPGGGYPDHVDKHDVAILVWEGECDVLGERVAPGSIVFLAAGEPHGIHNPGTTNALYTVFEFHNG